MYFLNYCTFGLVRGYGIGLLRKMKLIAVFLLLIALHVAGKGIAQKVTLSMQNEPLEKVIAEISRQSGTEILYNNDLIRKAGRVSVTIRNADVLEALTEALSSTRFEFRVVENNIVISPRAGAATSDIPATMPAATISGKVTEPDGKPLAYVSVANKTQKKAVQTDGNGLFSIAAAQGDVLEFSFVGYASRQYKVDGKKTTVSIMLVPKASELNEVVMIGYGSSVKKDLTGSVATVSSKEIQDIPFNTVDNAIAGKAAGVQVTKTDGTPGGAVRIRVRGSTSILGGNDPLYVIDGIPVQVQSNYINPGYDVSSPVGNDIAGVGGSAQGLSTAFVNGLNSLGGLNPDDIESITILKDASASAIYGSKAANGVVIITTKKGRKDMKPQITANYYATSTSIMRRPHVLNAQEYRMLITEAAVNSNVVRDLAGRAHRPQADQIVNQPELFFGKGNTDWIKEVTRSTLSHTAEIGIQGGGSASRYYTSIAYTSTPGIIKNTDFKRIVGKINLENEISNRFRLITNFNIGFTNQNMANGAYGQALRARPDYNPYDSTGAFVNFADVGYQYQGFQNPVAMLTAINNSKTISLLGSLNAVYDITPAFQFKSTVSLNNQIYNQRLYTPSYLQIGSFYGNVSSNGGIGSNSNSRFTDWFVENTLGYNKKWRDKHALNVLAGTSYETIKNSFFSATASGYPDDYVLNGLSGAVNPLFTRGDDPRKPQSYLISYYLRANYVFKDKYLLTFTGRADGSSKFGPDNKFGYFPSGAIAWRISKEKFLDNVAWIEDLKLRGSYGITGNQNIGNQMYRTLYSPYSYAGSSALVPTQLGNPKIKWETTKQADVGLDFSFFRNRLQGTADYFNKQTDDALLSLPVPPSSSYTSLLGNVVGIRNRGVEIAIQGDIIRTKNFRWNMSANISWSRSTVTKLSSIADLNSQLNSPTGIEYQNTTLAEGKPLGLMTGMKVNGIIKTQKELDDYKKKLGLFAGFVFPYLGIGDPMFQLDTVSYAAYGAAYPEFHAIIGSGAPKYFGGFSQSFSYKNFDLNLYFLYSQGGHLMWGDDVSSTTFVGTSNANTSMLKRYTNKNTGSNRPRLLLGDQLLYNSNLSIYNSSYLKLRTATLNYRFPASRWMSKAGIQSAAIYISATNLFTITRYPGNDPETSDDSYSVSGGYFDVSNYPAVRTFSIGAKMVF
ncbi:SusC/RagA family TonB-linked outer membrane protein [Chitinophaga tropicalis]|uniref:SusC/RagA family TonB-linked outer membrane protein n=1 Tax=Chitinophaga tropicalis TaxID=2683588 RepID=A0A7K1U4M6_9BACT|nr:SusC/RagA family TonB-linked outer membrane protein [Chitinophaga tropicalis]MVT09313.1 SusC/RagA family TonB-linked outer membrane protein [Chitinophaga tropicalis]